MRPVRASVVSKGGIMPLEIGWGMGSPNVFGNGSGVCASRVMRVVRRALAGHPSLPKGKA